MGVPVEDDVGPVLADRRRHPVGAQERPDYPRLALERGRGRRVVEQDDPVVAAFDRLEPVCDRLHLRGRVAVHLPQDRLAEVRQL